MKHKQTTPVTFQYDFVQNDQFNQIKFLICPRCSESLMRYDIEEYLTCPYCGYKFELNSQIEEFMLMPLLAEWERRQNY